MYLILARVIYYASINIYYNIDFNFQFYSAQVDFSMKFATPTVIYILCITQYTLASYCNSDIVYFRQYKKNITLLCIKINIILLEP